VTRACTLSQPSDVNKDYVVCIRAGN
jgi:hypothetical protein